jgi:nucleotide-binding universal stress UspA family protein
VDLVKRSWDHADVAHSDPDDPRLEPVMAAVVAVERAEKQLKAKRDQLAQAVADAIRADVRPSAIVRKTKYSAESIRQMARAKGIDPLRPATVTSIKNLPADHPLREG